MENHKVTLPPKGLDPARNRFALRFLVAGAIVPGVLFIIGYVVGPWHREGFLGTVLWSASWVLWPGWILLFDAEHAAEIVFGVLVGSAANAVYYYIVGFLIWDFREWRRRS